MANMVSRTEPISTRGSATETIFWDTSTMARNATTPLMVQYRVIARHLPNMTTTRGVLEIIVSSRVPNQNSPSRAFPMRKTVLCQTTRKKPPTRMYCSTVGESTRVAIQAIRMTSGRTLMRTET